MRDSLYTPCRFGRISRIEFNPSRRGSRKKSVLAIAPWFRLVALTQVPAQNPPSDPTLANLVYQKHCANCHGKRPKDVISADHRSSPINLPPTICLKSWVRTNGKSIPGCNLSRPGTSLARTGCFEFLDYRIRVTSGSHNHPKLA